jgi:hypothetical protein
MVETGGIRNGNGMGVGQQWTGQWDNSIRALYCTNNKIDEVYHNFMNILPLTKKSVTHYQTHALCKQHFLWQP